MKFELKEVLLGDVCEIKQGKYLAPKEMEPSQTEESEIPVIGGNGVLGYTNTSSYDFDVPLVTCRGSRCGLMQWGRNPSWISNNAMAVFFRDGKGDNRFLFHYLNHMDFDSVITGSAQPQITVTNLSLAKIKIPELRLQSAIAEILENLDHKIRINQQIASTLEQIAQTIFKSWFVDFDPVHAKARGKQPVGMDAETAALFPDSFEESDLGPIPRGWSSELLGNFADLTKGKSYKSSELEPSKVALVTLKSFKRGGGYRHDGLKAYSGSYKESQIVKAGDLIVAMTDVTQAADIVGKPALVTSSDAFTELVASLDVGIVRPKSNLITKNFLYFLFLTEKFDTQARAHASGTTVLHLGSDAIPSFPFPLPSFAELEAFAKIVDPCVSEIDSLNCQNLNLQSIRDSLLPRLISGELEIPAELLEA